MSALNLRFPDSVHRHIREIARQEGVSINLAGLSLQTCWLGTGGSLWQDA